MTDKTFEDKVLYEDENSFDKLFPELKDKLWCEEYDPWAGNSWVAEYGVDSFPKTTDRYLEVEDIKKHCLSKQRVREAIGDMQLKSGSIAVIEAFDSLYRLLGLDDK